MGDDDGRRQRRERNRDAVVDALLAIVADGDLAPSADAVAARAGLSTRSLFRYFDDVDDLCRAAIARQHERVAALLERPARRRRHRSPPAPATSSRTASSLFDAMGDVGSAGPPARARSNRSSPTSWPPSAGCCASGWRSALAPELDALGAERRRRGARRGRRALLVRGLPAAARRPRARSRTPPST